NKNASDFCQESEVYKLVGGWTSQGHLRVARGTIDSQDRRNRGNLPQHGTPISSGSRRCVGAQTTPQAAAQFRPVQGTCLAQSRESTIALCCCRSEERRVGKER